MRVSRKVAASSAALALLGAGTAAAVMLLGHETGTKTTRVHRPPPATAPERPHRQRARKPAADWTTYGFDAGRDHVAPRSKLRPPFRRLWAIHDPTFFEFPPVVSHGRLYIGTHGGRVLALESSTGRILWQRGFGRCVAASPAVAYHLVYVALMGHAPCTDAADGGAVVALDSATGRVRWRRDAGAVESSPLVMHGLVYFGSWDDDVYALDAHSGRLRWRFRTGDRVKAGPAATRRTIYIGSYDGRMYALDARSGALRWSADGGAFYATPAVAGGKVYDGSTDGRFFAYDAASGHLEWTAVTRSFVYAAPAVWRDTVYVGSYDHSLYAFDAGNGARRWVRDYGHPISGAATVLDGLVYFSTCGSCSQYESDARARHSYAVDARTGRAVWSFPDGEYSPVVSDGRRVYLMGFTTLYGLASKR